MHDEFVLFLGKLLTEGLPGAEMGSVQLVHSDTLCVSSLNSAMRLLMAFF